MKELEEIWTVKDFLTVQNEGAIESIFKSLKYINNKLEEKRMIAMKKMPTLFERQFENHTIVKCLDIVNSGCEWVINGEGYATEK